jgi:hypothetical protein
MQNRGQYGKFIDEVNSWLEKAFGLIDPMVGKCFRYDTLDQSMINYYEAGKVV